jgi:hypothetical protein
MRPNHAEAQITNVGFAARSNGLLALPAFDPTATLAALSGSALDAGFNPYRRICLNR